MIELVAGCFLTLVGMDGKHLVLVNTVRIQTIEATGRGESSGSEILLIGGDTLEVSDSVLAIEAQIHAKCARD